MKRGASMEKIDDRGFIHKYFTLRNAMLFILAVMFLVSILSMNHWNSIDRSVDNDEEYIRNQYLCEAEDRVACLENLLLDFVIISALGFNTIMTIFSLLMICFLFIFEVKK